MKTKQNNNEVMEIAEMQSKIDSYEAFIRTIYMMAKTGKKIVYPIFSRTGLNYEMNYMWRYVKQTKNIE